METLGLFKLPPCFFNSNKNPINRNHPNSHSARLIRCWCCYPWGSHFHSGSSSSSSTRVWDLKVKFSLREEWAEDDEEVEMGFGWREEKGKRRRWWDEDDDDSLDLEEEEEEGSGGVLEQVFDSIRIFKVFRSFGWMLPAIIISLLLENGPKAFLMALALPLGQSILLFAFDKLFGRTRERPKPRARPKKKPFARAANNFQGREKEEEEEEENNATTEKRTGYQTWVTTEDVKKGDQRRPSFGGWDELDRNQGSNKGPRRRPPRTTGAPSGLGLEMGKFSRKRRHRDAPLLLRLLIAVFPFLGSWSKLL